MDVSIIIVNYNTGKLVLDCLESVYALTRDVEFEIIVFDNNSTDSSVDIVKQAFPLVKVIASNINHGFGRGNNEAFKYAIGRNVFLLNPDTILVKNSVYALSSFLDNNKLCGIVGANLLNEDFSHQPSFSHYFPSLKVELLKLFGITFLLNLSTFNDTKNSISVSRVVGAALMIRREIIENIGFFDEKFFMYAEEDELCYRVKKAKYKIFNIPNSEILHLDGKSFKFEEERQKRRMEGLRTFYRVCYSKSYCKLLMRVEFLYIKSRILFYNVFPNKSKLKYFEFLNKNRWMI